MVSGLIFDVKRFSIHDGPGIRTTVFLKGCPLNCLWCHNPESQSPRLERLFRPGRCVHCWACLDACEQGAIARNGDSLLTDNQKCTLCGSCAEVCYADAREIVGREWTVSEVMDELQRDTPFYDESGGGVTFSGGEPLLQSDFLLALLQACRKVKIHTALDTCGFAPWQTLDKVSHHVDLFLYDLKLMDDARHRRFTGVSNEPILQNLWKLSQRGHAITLRVPVIPGVNDDGENLRQIADLAARLPHLIGVDLLPYHRTASDKYERMGRTYKLHDTQPPPEYDLNRAAAVLRQAGLQVKIGG